ncbi:hypothetical protein MJH12_06165, partial [bacterium]|nr:hypothetical protein [bacterium]
MLKFIFCLLFAWNYTVLWADPLYEVNQQLLGQKKELDSLINKINVGSSRLQNLEIEQDNLKEKIISA